MIQKIYYYIEDKKTEINFELLSHKCKINFSEINGDSFQYLEIFFKDEILQFRNHNYKWVDISQTRISCPISTKAVLLKSGIYIQPNINEFTWEVTPDKPNRIVCHFSSPSIQPLTNYISDKNLKQILPGFQSNKFECLEFLFSKDGIIEFSRSKIPFSAISCFTDHCDFDTLENLKLQREFFKKAGIRVTKGFFLNHYSKREDNASFENDPDELKLWEQDGHELAYHSLSQSIKGFDGSLDDFTAFQSPLNYPIKTWIDHGYQPYNLSLYKNNLIPDATFSELLYQKGVQNLWNYIDCGTSSKGVINQLDASQFTLKTFYNGNKNLGLKKLVPIFIKNLYFHFYGNESLILEYKNVSSSIKKFYRTKNLKDLVQFIYCFSKTTLRLLKIILFWNRIKNMPYTYAKYTPIVFNHNIDGVKFKVFQTIEMIDFQTSLNEKNLDLLIKDSGLFIAHTYFSVPMDYHYGRVINGNKINDIVEHNFLNLGNLIKEKQIWNPTLSELIEYLDIYSNVILDIDEKGLIYEKSATNLIKRNLK